MYVKKTAKGYTMVTGAVNLPRRLVRDVPYKYMVVTPAGEYWEALSIPGMLSPTTINRVLQGKEDINKKIPSHFHLSL